MTKQEYAEYEERIAMYLKGIEALSSGPCASCEECQRDRGQTEEEMESESELREDPWFSWSACEICNRPFGGNRVSWHGLASVYPVDGPTDRKKIIHGTCCEDCAYYMEMGHLDDITMWEIEHSS